MQLPLGHAVSGDLGHGLVNVHRDVTGTPLLYSQEKGASFHNFRHACICK